MVGHAHRRDVEVDEAVVRIARLRVVGRRLVAGLGEGLADLADGERQAADRAVAEEGLPVADLALCEVERL